MNESQSRATVPLRTNDLVVCLGGHDLEMVEIARLLTALPDVTVHDHGAHWGAKASEYLGEIRAALTAGRRVVLVELADDLSTDLPHDRLVWVDHHGPRAGADTPTAIEQIFALFGFPPEAWTRDRALVAANDRGHIAALQAAVATDDEIRDIRTRDRRAQGVTEQDEAQARDAISAAEARFGGRLTVVRLPHRRSSTVTDFLHPSHGGRGYENLLVLSPEQTSFYGDGRSIDALRAAYPESWCGGELPVRGYWGIDRTIALAELSLLLEPLKESPP